MASDAEQEDFINAGKDRLFKLLAPLAIKQTKVRKPSAEDIATAASLLAEGLHPIDAVKTLRGQSFADAVAIVYAASACRARTTR